MTIKHGRTRHDTIASFGWRDEFTIPAGTPVKWGQPDCNGDPVRHWALDKKTAIALSGNEHDARHRFVTVKPHLVAADEPASSTELTATGEQYVIPGCERNASPRAGQMDLFG